MGKVMAEIAINDDRGPRIRAQLIQDDATTLRLKVTDRDHDALEEMRIAAILAQFLRDTGIEMTLGEVRHVDDHDQPLVFGLDTDVEMDAIERRRESWRRSSRKYRAKKAVKQEAMFDE